LARGKEAPRGSREKGKVTRQGRKKEKARAPCSEKGSIFPLRKKNFVLIGGRNLPKEVDVPKAFEMKVAERKKETRRCILKKKKNITRSRNPNPMARKRAQGEGKKQDGQTKAGRLDQRGEPAAYTGQAEENTTTEEEGKKEEKKEGRFIKKKGNEVDRVSSTKGGSVRASPEGGPGEGVAGKRGGVLLAWRGRLVREGRRVDSPSGKRR